MNAFFLWLIKGYQKLISPFLGSRCRFHPSCSEYARQSFEQHSMPKAFLLVGIRLLKCHPFHPGGIDEVPGVRGHHHGQNKT